MARLTSAKWIRREKRLAIYLRDGLACVYCGRGLETVQLTLDHLTPRSHGGNNGEANLVTACIACNSSRGDRPVEDFAEAVANYVNHGVTSGEIVAFIEETRNRVLKPYVEEAKALIARRGSYSEALYGDH